MITNLTQLMLILCDHDVDDVDLDVDDVDNVDLDVDESGHGEIRSS